MQASNARAFLPALPQLKEVHLNEVFNVFLLFAQQRRNGRVDLKIFFFGFLVDGPEDPAFEFSRYFHRRETFDRLAEDPSRLADEIPVSRSLDYTCIEPIAPLVANNFVARLTELRELGVFTPIKDVQRFLDFLKNFDQIVHLKFTCDQPQDLFDRLPEHSAVQRLDIYGHLADLQFLARLKHLLHLELYPSMRVEAIRNAFELPFLLVFTFKHYRVMITPK